MLLCSFCFCLTPPHPYVSPPKINHFCERAVYHLLISYNATCPNRYIPVMHCTCDQYNTHQGEVPIQSRQDVVWAPIPVALLSYFLVGLSVRSSHWRYEISQGSNKTVLVNWVAFASVPHGSQIGTTSLNSWTTGTKCKRINFQQVRICFLKWYWKQKKNIKTLWENGAMIVNVDIRKKKYKYNNMVS